MIIEHEELHTMVSTLMSQDFIYDGTSYNMFKLGWGFQFNNRKRSLGTCNKRTKTICLSRWLIDNSNEPLSTWRNTMLHEIAHAIDIKRRGKSDHSYAWRRIAKAIGCNANRTTKVNLDTENIVSKYTMVCDTCGHERPSHKIKKRKSSCGKCCPTYNEKYLLRQVKNY